MNVSEWAINYSLLQKDSNKKLYSVVYNEWKLITAELNYLIHKKELLMIKQTLCQWNYYIDNKHTTIILINHESLKYLKTTKTSLKCLTHWVLEFAEYDLDIKYCKDSETVVSNMLSHRSDFISKTPVNWVKKMWSVFLWHLDQDNLWLIFMIVFINKSKKLLEKL